MHVPRVNHHISDAYAIPMQLYVGAQEVQGNAAYTTGRLLRRETPHSRGWCWCFPGQLSTVYPSVACTVRGGFTISPPGVTEGR